MPVICIANQKGGVGKTTTTAALAKGLSEHDRRVLLIDWDPQASLTITMGIDPETLERTVYDIFMDTMKGRGKLLIHDVVGRTGDPNIHLIPANIELSQAELDLVGEMKRELMLREMLQPVRRAYDYILVDCLPSLGLLTINALSAADRIIIPLQAEYLAMKGVGLLLNTVSRVKERINPGLEIAGVLLTMVSLRTLHSREVIEVTRKVFGERIKVFDTVIPASVRFKEAPAAGESILTYAANTDGANAYRLFTEEVIRNEEG